MEEIGPSLMEILSQNLPGGIKENEEKPKSQ
jgi:hypothetical protein